MAVTREAVATAASDMANDLRDDMVASIMRAFDALTQDERDEFAGCAGIKDNPIPVVRVLGTVVGPRVVSDRFEAEATRSSAKKAARILSKRYV